MLHAKLNENVIIVKCRGSDKTFLPVLIKGHLKFNVSSLHKHNKSQLISDSDVLHSTLTLPNFTILMRTVNKQFENGTLLHLGSKYNGFHMLYFRSVFTVSTALPPQHKSHLILNRSKEVQQGVRPTWGLSGVHHDNILYMFFWKVEETHAGTTRTTRQARVTYKTRNNILLSFLGFGSIIKWVRSLCGKTFWVLIRSKEHLKNIFFIAVMLTHTAGNSVGPKHNEKNTWIHRCGQRLIPR